MLKEGQTLTSREGDVRTITRVQTCINKSNSDNAAHEITYLVAESPEHYVVDVDGSICRYRNAYKTKKFFESLPKSTISKKELIEQISKMENIVFFEVKEK